MQMSCNAVLQVLACLLAVSSASGLLVTSACQDFDVRLVDSWLQDGDLYGTPQVYIEGAFRPICGQYFRQSSSGVDILCQQIGHYSSHVFDSGEKVEQDAAFIDTGSCTDASLATCGINGSYAVGSLDAPDCRAGVGEKAVVVCFPSSDFDLARLQSCSPTCDNVYRINPWETAREYSNDSSLTSSGMSVLDYDQSYGWQVATAYEGPGASCSGYFHPEYAVVQFRVAATQSGIDDSGFVQVVDDGAYVELNLDGCVSGIFRFSVVYYMPDIAAEKLIHVNFTDAAATNHHYEFLLSQETSQQYGATTGSFWQVDDFEVELQEDYEKVTVGIPAGGNDSLHIESFMLLKAGMQVPDLPGVWFASSRFNASCFEVCDSYSLDYDYSNARHQGSQAASRYFTKLSSTAEYAGFECVALSSIVGSDGSYPDPSVKSAACQFVCPCTAADGNLKLESRYYVAGNQQWSRFEHGSAVAGEARVTDADGVTFDIAEQAFEFDGETVMTATVNTSDSQWLTFMAWVKVKAGVWDPSSAAWVLTESWSANTRSLSLADFSYAGGQPPTTFFHVAMTWDGTARKAYLNGELNADVTLPAVNDTIDWQGGQDIFIGGNKSNGADLNLNGLLISDVLVYAWALPPHEIRAIYSLGQPSTVNFEASAEIDLTSPKHVAGLITQGSSDTERFMARFYVQRSNDGVSWTSLEGPFRGNWEPYIQFATAFSSAEEARYVRIVNRNRDWQGLRMGALTCEPPDYPWEMRSGACDLTADYCLTTPNYPDPYDDSSECRFQVMTRDTSLRVEDWPEVVTSIGDDGFIGSDNTLYTTEADVDGLATNAYDDFFWTSDGSNSASSGFKVCPGCYMGEFRNQSGCFDCPVGRYSNATDVTECEACVVGYSTSGSGQTSCEDCGDGFTTDADGLCEACQAGEIEVEGVCEPCNPGFFFLAGTCQECPAGRSSNASADECYICSAGFFSSMGDPSCTICKAGNFSLEESSSCMECSGGHFSDTDGASECIGCSSGEYAAPGQSACSVCPVGTWSRQRYEVCEDCDAGRYSNTTGNRRPNHCEVCSAGTFSLPGAIQCTNCTSGRFSAADESQECQGCSAGQYAGVDGLTGCSDCLRGEYSDANAMQCEACPKGRYGLSNGTNFTGCTQCAGGKFSNVEGATEEVVCEVCEAGKYSIDGSSACTSCPEGRYNPDSEGAGESVCLPCPAGNFSSLGAQVCEPCDPGRFSTEGSSSCPECSAGQFSEGQATECSNCSAGRASTALASECEICSSGTYSPVGSPSCVDCDAGFASLNEAEECDPCAPGRWRSESEGLLGNCSACPAGRFREDFEGTSADDCDLCAAGTASAAASDAPEDCIECAAGRFAAAGSTCEPCQAGQLSAARAGACENCTAGYYSEDEGADECLECDIGRFSRAGVTTCQRCPEGQYIGTIAAASCEECEVGRYMSYSIAVSDECILCTSGSVAVSRGKTECEWCAAGRTSNSLLSACQDCGLGFFSSETDPNCTACSRGEYAGSATQADACDACVPGQFASQERASACTSCVEGHYEDGDGSSECSPCIAGWYSTEVGATACKQCEAGWYSGADGLTECFSCVPGRYSSAGAVFCTNCSSGAYQDASTATACHQCRPGTHGTGIAMISEASACLSCTAGKTNGNPGRPSEADCLSCEPGEYSDEGAPSCTECPAGTYNEEFLANSIASCLLCSRGTYTGLTGRSLAAACENCLEGQFSSQDGSSACDLCPAGAYASEDGRSDCIVCEAGRYINDTGATSCTLCEMGLFRVGSSVQFETDPNADLDSTACSFCPTGRFGNRTEAVQLSECLFCGPGSFGGTVGLTRCSLCQAGTSADTEGMTACGSCPSGASTEGAKQCCPEDNDDSFPVSASGSLTTAPGKSSSAIHVLDACGGSSIARLIEGTYNSGLSEVNLATHKGGNSFQDCLTLRCDGCNLQVVLSRDDLLLGDRIRVAAQVEYLPVAELERDLVYGELDYAEHQCTSRAQLIITGFGCANNTLAYFFLSLVMVIFLTVVIGLALNAYERMRVTLYLHCALDISLPKIVGAKEQWPTETMLWEMIGQGLEDHLGGDYFRFSGSDRVLCGKQRGEDLPRGQFTAIAQTNPNESVSIRVEFDVRTTRGKKNELRRALVKTNWIPNPKGSLWEGATVAQQPPVIIKTAGSTPGKDLVEGIEDVVTRLFNRNASEGKKMYLEQIHAEVAEELLKSLTRWWVMAILIFQYFLGICALAGFPYYAFTLVWTCDDGYPLEVHYMWGGYMAVSGFISMFMLFFFGGKNSWLFIKNSVTSLVVNFVFMVLLHMDAYQDVTFPVIANKCNFDLWFVSAWLVVVGVALMQIAQQIAVLIYSLWQYKFARTPEERERLAVEGVFLAVRGSDNLVLVHAIKPAVQEQLGGASSWAMKTSEARISFCRFFFEDVEQSALQAVFLIFYTASAGDIAWVTGSICMSLLVSFTLVVQVLPEVRDWLWHRLLPMFFGATRYRVVRAVWLVVLVVVYRAIYAFPWISACSPAGDECVEEDDSEGVIRMFSKALQFLFWACRDGERSLLFYKAKQQEAEEVVVVSGLCCAGFLISALLASIVWGAGSQYQKWQNRAAVVRERYNKQDRLESQTQVLREKGVEDDDPWLPPARELYKAAKSMPGDPEMKKLARKIEAVDKLAFDAVRGTHRRKLRTIVFGWWCRCRYCQDSVLERKVQKIRMSCTNLGDKLRDKLSEPQVYAEALAVEAMGAWRIATIKSNVKLCLTHRNFSKIDIGTKADWIYQATSGKAPLKLVHWRTLDRLRKIPKHGETGGYAMDLGAGEPGGQAMTVPEAIQLTARRVSIAEKSTRVVSEKKAIRHLVPFFFSHRWLHTSGPQENHRPDSTDNVKARALVNFAKWFTVFAKKQGLTCEVFFWIDYSCCEQVNPQAHQIGITSLPLYIGSCMKVVAWRTPDFDQRAWLMVERLLSYSFCNGGLMPYSIDDSMAPEEDEEPGMDLILEPEPAAPAPRTRSVTIHKWEIETDGGWQAFDDETQARLRTARDSGHPEIMCKRGRFEYQINIVDLVQLNVETKKERKIREVQQEVQVTDPAPEPPVAPPPPVTGLLASFDIVAPDVKVNRRPRKLPNPLDWDACQVTRTSDKRVIGDLVKIALTIPALEVFADRQPVEWGLTEVVEQSLRPGAELPRPDETTLDQQSVRWLTPSEAKRTTWRLIVVTAEDLKKRRYNHDADAFIWVDDGVETLDSLPSDDELEETVDKAFDAVDEAVLAGTDRNALDEALRWLIRMLKTLMADAARRKDPGVMNTALWLARDVEMPMRQTLKEEMCNLRIQEAKGSGDDAQMRRVLRLAQDWGCTGTEDYQELERVCQEQEREALERRLEEALKAVVAAAEQSGDLDLLKLKWIHTVGSAKSLKAGDDAFQVGFEHFDYHRKGQDVEKVENLLKDAKLQKWDIMVEAMELAMAAEELMTKYASKRKNRRATGATIPESVQEEIEEIEESPDLKVLTEGTEGMIEVDIDELSARMAAADVADDVVTYDDKATPSSPVAVPPTTSRRSDVSGEDEGSEPEKHHGMAGLLFVSAWKEIASKAKQLRLISLHEDALARVDEIKVDVKEEFPSGWDAEAYIKQLSAGSAQVAKAEKVASAEFVQRVEETDTRLIEHMQALVNDTFFCWAQPTGRIATQDRKGLLLPKRLIVRSVIYIQNPFLHMNYAGRMKEIQQELTEWQDHFDPLVREALQKKWPVKTADQAPNLCSDRSLGPLNRDVGECFLWHGTTPDGAKGITDSEFDIQRAGTRAGTLYGNGVYLAESCMKSDEYVKEDGRGLFPFLLCRVVLGNTLYVDTANPPEKKLLEDACTKGGGGGYHSVLGDREKCRKTFREFMVYDSHQVYPEYLVWMERVF